MVRVLNASVDDVLIKKGTPLGEAEEVEVCGEIAECSAKPTKEPASPLPKRSEEMEHLIPVLNSLPADLSPEENRRATELVCRNADLFSKSDFDLGRSSTVQHEIDTGINRPFKQALRRHPLCQLPVIDEHVDRMLAANIIEPAASPWASNVVLVRRPDNTYRFCIDYRGLNARTQPDSYPLPRIDSCLDALGGAKYFTTLDLRSGYWQVPMEPQSAEKTAFVTRKGMWKFKAMPFGLTNAPATFQRLMDATMAGLAWEVCLIYLDDIIIFADNFPKHVERLKLVFERLRAANLKLKPEKCRIFQRKVCFLGSVISEHGVQPDEKKVQAVADWPVPRNLTEVRGFVALASYYRRHIAHFADIARPLHELTRKGRSFHWTERQQEAFEKLKRCLISAPLLAPPIDAGKYVLDTDASDQALGAVLQQEQNGELRVVAYASRALHPPERSYSTTRKELLAIVYGLKYFRQFLLGTRFDLRTDHAALTFLLRTPEPVGQQARWLDLIGEFDFQIIHRPGVQHRNSDALSRRPEGRDHLDVTPEEGSLVCNSVQQQVMTTSCVEPVSDDLVVASVDYRASEVTEVTAAVLATENPTECSTEAGICVSRRPSPPEPEECVSTEQSFEAELSSNGMSAAQEPSAIATSIGRLPGRAGPRVDSSFSPRTSPAQQEECTSAEGFGGAALLAGRVDVCQESPAVARSSGCLPEDGYCFTSEIVAFSAQRTSPKRLVDVSVAEEVARGGVPGGDDSASPMLSAIAPQAKCLPGHEGEVFGDNHVICSIRPSASPEEQEGRSTAELQESRGAVQSSQLPENLVRSDSSTTGSARVGEETADWADREELREAQLTDSDIKIIFEKLEAGKDKPSANEAQAFSDDARTYWRQWEALDVVNGVLCRKFWNASGQVEYFQILIPHKLKQTVMQEIHTGMTGGHFSFSKSKDQVQRRAYWPTWLFCRCCDVVLECVVVLCLNKGSYKRSTLEDRGIGCILT